MPAFVSAQDIPIDFVEQVERQKCLVFVSPNVSIPPGDLLGPPGPTLLALELAIRLGGHLDDHSLPWVAQFYAERSSPHALREYVVERLTNVNYQPTLAHHLLVRIPLPLIVSTAQDGLLLEAFRQNSVPVNPVLQGASLSYGTGRVLLQLYGTAARPETLLLTEDECRQVLNERSDLARFLQERSASQSLLFLGYTLADPFFREFYYRLRPQPNSNAPRAYLVQANADEDDSRYWQQRNASVLQIETLAFLQQLADQLAQRGKVEISPGRHYKEPAPMSVAERSQRKDTFLKFSQQLGLTGAVESGAQLQPIVNSLAFLRQTLAENKMLNDSEDKNSSIPIGLSREEMTAQILLQQGNIEWAEGNFDQAREYFDESLRKEPGLIDAYLSLYYLLVEIGELEEAAGIYRRILVSTPEQAFLPGRYQIQKILGQTDVGIGYCVLDSETQQLITITILRRTLAHQTEALGQFVQEVGKIESKRISRLLGYDRYHGRNYLITEYVEGPILCDHLKEAKTIPFHEAMQLADQIAEAVEDGQKHGLPALNLQPENIVLTPTGAVLVNYSFPRLVQLLKSTRKGFLEAGIEYQAPEQRAGVIGDSQSDVYALGSVLYEMLSGRSPNMGTFRKVSELYPQFGEAIDVVIDRARDANVENRFRSITEMRKEVQRITLFVRKDWPGQYLRLALSRLSNLYIALFSRQGILTMLTLLLAIYAIETFQWQPLIMLRGLSRLIGLLLLSSLLTSTLGYYIVRETARQEGLGSLISSGRGMGAILGWLLLLWVYQVTDFGATSLGAVGLQDLVGYILLSLALVIILTFGSFVQINYIGHLAEKWWRHYTVGFYLSYAILIILITLLTLSKTPLGFINY